VQLLRELAPETQTTSDIAGEVAFAPTARLGVRTSLVWDPNEERMESSFIEGRYTMDNGSIFNLGYAYRREYFAALRTQAQDVRSLQPQTEEVRASSYLPLDNNWSIFGAINYSLEENLSVEDMIGIEYDSCCWTFRLLNLRYYNNDNGVLPDFDNPELERNQTLQFQVVLKGMGGLGNRITNIMQDMIRGFDERGY
jgi:LPS-assembly protein